MPCRLTSPSVPSSTTCAAQGQLAGAGAMIEAGRDCQDIVTEPAAVSRPSIAPDSKSPPVARAGA